MKNTGRYLLFLLVLFGFINKVNAVCDSKARLELSTAASNVTMDYEIETFVFDIDGNIHRELNPSDIEISETSSYQLDERVVLKISNVTDKIFVALYSEEENINEEYHYKDLENGTLVYNVPDTLIIRHFTLTIYSESLDCEMEELRKIEVATPKYNDYFEEGVCQNNNASYCNKYVTTDVSISESEYRRLLDEYMKNMEIPDEEENPTQNNKEDNSKKVILYSVGIVIIVVLLVLVIVSIFKRRKRTKEMESMRGV